MDRLSLCNALSSLLGEKGWLTSHVDSYQTDWLNQISSTPLGVARPTSTDSVATVMRLAREAGVPVTPQGGNTGLCAGGVPGQAGAIILSLSRMRKILSIDPVEFTVTVEAGVILADLNASLEDKGLMVPMHLGAEGSAQIGGLISTNAGGSHALRYGMMQDLVLGLEVVLPDGSVWNGARPLLKDNSGYQLRRLFCGAEGTLGIVTRAVLRPVPRPRRQVAALLALSGFDEAVRLGTLLRQSFSEFVSGLEFFSEAGLALALRHMDELVFPLDTRPPVYVLAELTSSAEEVPLESMLETALGEALASELVLDGAIASTESQRKAFWRLREEMPEGQRREGPQLKHDIAVPVATLPTFIEEASNGLNQRVPGLRINPFGHLGDGNIHFNLSPPAGEDDFPGDTAELSHFIYKLAVQMGGSFAAEHGLGRTKIDIADSLRSPIERQLMRKIKQALDPSNLMNPGVILHSRNNQEELP